MSGKIGDLRGIWAISGTAQDGPEEFRGFVTIRAEAADGDVLVGQLPPESVRRMALDFLGAAEAADQDAIVFRIMVGTVGVDAPTAARLVAQMREERGDPQPPGTGEPK